MKTFEWAIEDIITAHPDLYLEHCAVMAVVLMSQQSASPCEFVVEIDGVASPRPAVENKFLLRVSWNAHTLLNARRMMSTEQRKPIAERAAVALAALLFARLIPDGQMRVTQAGDRADYWLPHLQCALEVSGTENFREFARRHKEKIAQVLSNPLRWNGYVIICCFDKTQRLIRWSYHQQESK